MKNHEAPSRPPSSDLHDNLNRALADDSRFHSWTLEQLLYNIASLPEAIQTAVRNNGGGVYNHLLYFAGLAPASGTLKGHPALCPMPSAVTSEALMPFSRS